MTLRSAEMTMLEPTSTKVMDSAMPTAPETVVVTASAEQQPSTRRSTGFSRMMPAVNTFHLLCFSAMLRHPLQLVVVAVDGRVDGGVDRVGGDRGAGNGVHRAAVGHMLGGIPAHKAGVEVLLAGLGADAGGLGGGVHQQVGDIAGGVK